MVDCNQISVLIDTQSLGTEEYIITIFGETTNLRKTLKEKKVRKTDLITKKNVNVISLSAGLPNSE